jgi:hypothetical protein
MPNDDIPSQIAALEASLAQPLPETARRLVEQQLAALRQQCAALVDLGNAQTGDVSVGDVAGRDVLKGSVEVNGTVQGAAVGVNQGTVNVNLLSLTTNSGTGSDSLQLRILVAIRDRTGEASSLNVWHNTVLIESLGISEQELSDELKALKDESYITVSKYVGAILVELTPKARKLLRSLSE